MPWKSSAVYEELRKQYEKDQTEIAQLQKAADELHLWAFMGSGQAAQARVLHGKAHRAAARPPKGRARTKKLSVRFRQKEFLGDEVLVLDGRGEVLRRARSSSPASTSSISAASASRSSATTARGKSTLLTLHRG